MKGLLVWFIIMLSVIGLLIRLESIRKRINIYENCIKVFVGEIIAIFVLTVLGKITYSQNDFKLSGIYIALMCGFVIYKFAEENRNSDGGIDSVLIIIKCYMVTLLSFQEEWRGILGAIFIGLLSFAIYKSGIFQEKKSNLIEIIFLCIEAVIFCILGWKQDLVGLNLLVHIFFQETAIYLINFVVVSLVELVADRT